MDLEERRREVEVEGVLGYVIDPLVGIEGGGGEGGVVATERVEGLDVDSVFLGEE